MSTITANDRLEIKDLAKNALCNYKKWYAELAQEYIEDVYKRHLRRSTIPIISIFIRPKTKNEIREKLNKTCTNSLNYVWYWRVIHPEYHREYKKILRIKEACELPGGGKMNISIKDLYLLTSWNDCVFS